VIKGQCRVTTINPQGQSQIVDFNAGDAWYFPRGFGHSIEGIGSEDCLFVLVFDNGYFSEFGTFSISDWVGHTPPEVLGKYFGVPASTFANFPKREVYIAKGPVPPALPANPAPGALDRGPLTHRYQLLAQRPDTYSGGTNRLVSQRQFPISTTVTGALMQIKPGGLREPHWHPNADEWQYYISGRARMSVFGSHGRVRTEEFNAGDVGYVIAGIKTLSEVAIGDTITDPERPAAAPLPGYKEAKPVVFSSIYPIATDEYEDLAKALEKLKLNDAALTYQKDSSTALGFGFRCGFLGLLHLEVVQERLEREHGLSLLLSAPSVRYEVVLSNGDLLHIDNPSLFPDPGTIDRVREPFIKAAIMVPERYLGAVMELCRERRGSGTTFEYLAVGRLQVTSELPLAEVLFDFYDRLKTITQGYGSFDYEILDYRETDLVKVDILVNGEKLDALSQLVHRDKARTRALHYCERLAETIPRQNFKIAIQGAIGGTIIARSTINPYRKDVTAKCYGGDITRKRKLLEKQKEGKKRMKMVGAVEVPQAAFMAVLKSDID